MNAPICQILSLEERGLTVNPHTESKTPRQHWMSVLARASLKDLEQAIASLGPMPAFDVMKPAETGTIMLEGRAGGAGRRFNIGEATMTRCVVRLEDGTMGFSYALGRDKRKAQLAAVLDGMLQLPTHATILHNSVIGPLAEQQASKKIDASRKAAATKVDFFTLVRGDG
jgi:alpha-D-ribose 1-methylphosphonate 5-triphosphate synthase subunit PhnG